MSHRAVPILSGACVPVLIAVGLPALTTEAGVIVETRIVDPGIAQRLREADRDTLSFIFANRISRSISRCDTLVAQPPGLLLALLRVKLSNLDREIVDKAWP